MLPVYCIIGPLARLYNKPLSTREYGKTRSYSHEYDKTPGYQAGGDVTPTADQLAQQTTAQLPQQPTAAALSEQTERQLDPRYWASLGKPALPPTHRKYDYRTGNFEPA